MKARFFPDTRTLHIELADRPSTCSQTLSDGVVIDLDGEGQPVAVTVELGAVSSWQHWARVPEAAARLQMSARLLYGLINEGLLDGCFYRAGTGRTALFVVNIEAARAVLIEGAKRKHDLP